MSLRSLLGGGMPEIKSEWAQTAPMIFQGIYGATRNAAEKEALQNILDAYERQKLQTDVEKTITPELKRLEGFKTGAEDPRFIPESFKNRNGFVEDLKQPYINDLKLQANNSRSLIIQRLVNQGLTEAEATKYVNNNFGAETGLNTFKTNVDAFYQKYNPPTNNRSKVVRGLFSLPPITRTN